MSASTTTPGPDGLEPIRRVKTVETETEQTLTAFAAKAKADLETLGREAETLVQKARADAEAARDAFVGQKRADADREAEAILADGRVKAAQIRAKGPRELDDQKDALLDAVLGSFRANGKA